MITTHQLVSMNCSLTHDALDRWIELGWVFPTAVGQEIVFDPIDVARVGLISELHVDLGIDEDNMALVLSLMDQLYAARRSFNAVMTAVASQPDAVRSRIVADIASQQGASVKAHE